MTPPCFDRSLAKHGCRHNIWPYSYATLNDRVPVVDPETRVVMANVSRY